MIRRVARDAGSRGAGNRLAWRLQWLGHRPPPRPTECGEEGAGAPEEPQVRAGRGGPGLASEGRRAGADQDSPLIARGGARGPQDFPCVLRPRDPAAFRGSPAGPKLKLHP